jgi:hypothetical protein
MRRIEDWSQLVSKLSVQDQDTIKTKQIYAKQWAHDVRCVQSGIKHRRVGEAQNRTLHEEWLQAGFVAQQRIIKTRI